MAATARLTVICLECERTFRTANPAPECPRCGGTDVDLADDVGRASAASHRAPAFDTRAELAGDR